MEEVEATAIEMTQLCCRPWVSFQVASTGLITDVKLLRSSGSRTLDQKAVWQASAGRYPRHNCGLCRVFSPMNLGFEGPVWIREPDPRAMWIVE
jgi:hypothetical protein